MDAPAGTPPERVDGTIVFTDIVGFTEFTATRGDAEALELLAVQARLLETVLPDDARIVKELGDGLLLWYPQPLPALHSAFALHRGFEAQSAATGLPLWIRIGMHVGSALLRGADVVGHDVNVAARIVDIAAPGEVLVSDALRAVVDTRSTQMCFAELGPVVMKGIPEPIRLWRASDG